MYFNYSKRLPVALKQAPAELSIFSRSRDTEKDARGTNSTRLWI